MEWFSGPAREMECRACGSGGTKQPRVTFFSQVYGHEVTCYECPHCGALSLDTLPPPSYLGETSQGAHDHYVIQGAAIDVMILPLFRLEPSRIRRYMEIGCSFGFSLDFARHAFGWEVIGLDPSPVAASGAERLGLDIRPDYLTEDSPLARQSVDLLLASEVIEHVPDPASLLRLLGRTLTEEGVLLLTTPNAEVVKPGSANSALNMVLGEGHVVLFTAAALEKLLRECGFTHVEVNPAANTLWVLASRKLLRLREGGSIDRRLYADYLAKRAYASSLDAVTRLGFASRLVKELVNQDRDAEAEPVIDLAAELIAAQYGIDIKDPESVGRSSSAVDFRSYAVQVPTCLVSLFYFWALLLYKRGDIEPALARFRMAVVKGSESRRQLRSFGWDDGETEDLVWEARAFIARCFAGLDPAGAVEAALMLDRAAPDDPLPPEWWLLPPARAARHRGSIFLRLLELEHFAPAAKLAPTLLDNDDPTVRSVAIGLLAEGRADSMAAVKAYGDAIAGEARSWATKGEPGSAYSILWSAIRAACGDQTALLPFVEALDSGLGTEKGRAEVERRLLTDLVAHGDYAVAQMLAGWVAAHPAEEATPSQVDAIWSLGVLALNHGSDFTLAASWFGEVATIVAQLGSAASENQRALGSEARCSRVEALIQADPIAAEQDFTELAEDERVPRDRIDSLRRQLVIALGGQGAYESAERVAEPIAAELQPVATAEIGVRAAELAAHGPVMLNVIWSLAMIALNHRQDWRRAADLFELVHAAARTALTEGVDNPSASALLWPSGYHAALAADRAGESRRVREMLAAFKADAPAALPPIPPDLSEAIQKLAA